MGNHSLNVDHSMTLGPNHRPIIVRLDWRRYVWIFVYERDGVWQQERFSIDGVEFDNKQPSLVFHEQTNQGARRGSHGDNAGSNLEIIAGKSRSDESYIGAESRSPS